MPLYIRDERIKTLAEEVARLGGTTMTEAVRMALVEAKKKIEDDRQARRAEADAALAELRALVAERGRPIDENILYDERGDPVL